ncbi:MAG: ATP-binding cassette domain-containing protein [Oscillospiraceae bacterium]|jgi:cobalt/nickel transport system ATP-binding protein|nr:ATP-binding cassette domain-containing protein [Oscillospiraceae bacterium]
MVIETRGLVYEYEGGERALDGVDFAPKRGEITALLGANGAGKSTLFLHLNGILRPKSGAVLLDGAALKHDRKSLLELRRRVGIVFQDPDDQLFSADVYSDVSFGAVNLGLPPDEVARRVERAMAQTGVTELRDRPTHALSHGQKKRVAIAGVLAMEAELMILDEPTAGLDPQGTAEIMRLLPELRDKLGMTVILATHDIDIVPLYCKHAYLMRRGQTVFSGEVAELLARAELLRENGLRLPRIAHLMEILRREDGVDVGADAATISGARRELKRVLGDG